MSRSRYRFGEEYFPHFMTDTIVAWLPVFSQPCFAEVVFDSWRFLQREREIEILSFVVMENHVHWIAVGPELGKRVKEFKSFTATSILKLMKQNGYQTLLQELSYFKLRHKSGQQHQLWQEGSHPKIIDTEEMMWQKIEYIHHNPLRRGFIDDPPSLALLQREKLRGASRRYRCLYRLEIKVVSRPCQYGTRR